MYFNNDLIIEAQWRHVASVTMDMWLSGNCLSSVQHQAITNQHIGFVNRTLRNTIP